MRPDSAAIVTVGSELVEGLRVDTNTAEIARALTSCGFHVAEAISIGDDVDALAETLRRLTGQFGLVVTTGGLGPTHDDVTRDAAAAALGLSLSRDSRIEELLRPLLRHHVSPDALDQVFTQADVIHGAEVMDPTTGTAPGLVIPTPAGALALLPGPPSEMRPMLARIVARYAGTRSLPADLGVTGLSESDAQVIALSALEAHPGVSLTVLARPGDVRVIIVDEGAGAHGVARAAHDVATALGDACYSTDGSSMAETVVHLATTRALTFSLAESCTGGLVAGEVTSVAGASAPFLGGVVSYSDRAKVAQLGVADSSIAQFGAVSEEVAREMALGARARFIADYAIAVTGIAGPGGGSADKPVGLVWFAVAGPHGIHTVSKRFRPSSRAAIRERSVTVALDLLRRELLSS